MSSPPTTRTPLLSKNTGNRLPTSSGGEHSPTTSYTSFRDHHLASSSSGGPGPMEIEKGDGGGLYHCHTSARQLPFDYGARRTLIIACCICVAFMSAEIVGGLVANSLAIITDAAHLMTDFASFLISLFSLYVSSRPASRNMSFGWHRAEVLGALASVLMIWVLTGVLVYLAIQRIINQEYNIDAIIMLITAGLGVLVNIVMGVLLHYGGGGHGHSHGAGGASAHGHSHGGATANHRRSNHYHQTSHSSEESDDSIDGAERRHKNINVRAAFIHVLGDLVQSIGVFIAALVIYFVPNAGIADPICTFVFSILVLITTLTILKDALRVLMEGMPKGVDFGDVTETLAKIDGVMKVHDLRIWALTMDKIALSVHLAVDPKHSTQWILKRATTIIRNKYNIYESTIQIEGYTRRMDDCTKCEQPK